MSRECGIMVGIEGFPSGIVSDETVGLVGIDDCPIESGDEVGCISRGGSVVDWKRWQVARLLLMLENATTRSKVVMKDLLEAMT